MRFRVKRGGPARRFVFDRIPQPRREPEHSVPKAAELDNPYSRYYGRARSREDLRKA